MHTGKKSPAPARLPPPVAPVVPTPLPPRAVGRITDPDLVDRIFDYIVEQIPELAAHHFEIKRQIREEFASQHVYVRRLRIEQLAPVVLDLFNGRNATEIARKLGICRATVYRLLKQPGRR
jgi:putative lipoic acid-binding regulatory protein